MTLLTVLDIGVAILLLATIGFCTVLNRRLAALRRNESELAQVLHRMLSVFTAAVSI